jgi:hypothetical protein
MWLPALGAALFIVAGIWWATKPSPKQAEEPEEQVAPAAADAGPAGRDAGSAQMPSDDAIKKLIELRQQQK